MSLAPVPITRSVAPVPLIDWLGDHCAFATIADEIESAAAWLSSTAALVGFQSTLTWTRTFSPGLIRATGGTSDIVMPADGVEVGVGGTPVGVNVLAGAGVAVAEPLVVGVGVWTPTGVTVGVWVGVTVGMAVHCGGWTSVGRWTRRRRMTNQYCSIATVTCSPSR